MNKNRLRLAGFPLLPLFILFLSVSPSLGQTFISGSSGTDGAFAPSADITLALPAGGVFHYTTVDIPAGVTVSYTPNSANTPVTLLATGDINIEGTLSATGGPGLAPVAGILLNQGGLGGPGGFPGGSGGIGGSTTNTTASPGHGPGSSHLGFSAGYGAPDEFLSLLPLFGGSGGGGGIGGSIGGPSGGGGGGAILLASSNNITVNGVVITKGGRGWTPGQFSCDPRRSGPGSGGAIRLVASQISGSGSLNAEGGSASSSCQPGGRGRTRLEAFTQTFTGTATDPSFATPGPVNVSSAPILTNLPTLTISSIGGLSSPAIPLGSYATADISLPIGTVNPVPVVLSMTNTPVGTSFTFRVTTQFVLIAFATSTPSTGSFSSSSATSNLALPTGAVSVIHAYASFSVPAQTAALFPKINGEPIKEIMLATKMGEDATLHLLTASGVELPAKSHLRNQQLAKLWEAVQKQ